MGDLGVVVVVEGGMIEMYKLSHDLYNKEAVSYFLDFRHNHIREQKFRVHEFNLLKKTRRKNVRKYSLINGYSFKYRVTNQ